MKDEMSKPINKNLELIKKMPKETKNASKQFLLMKNNMISDMNLVKTSVFNGVKSIGKSFLGIGALAGGLALKTGLSEAIGIEGFKTQLQTATKDTKKASQIMKYSMDLANSTPFEGSQLVEGASKFEAMGMSAEKWLTITGDMAAGTNKDFNQAVEAIIDAQNGELERLKEFGITKQKITDKANKMFGKGVAVNNKGQIVNQQKFNDALMELMKDSFAGGMEAQSKTIKGVWSTVTGVTKNALANILGMQNDGEIASGSFLEKMKNKLLQLSETLVKWQSDGTIERLTSSFSNGINKVWDMARVVKNELVSALAWLKDNMSTVSFAVKLFISLLIVNKVLSFANGLMQSAKVAMTLVKGFKALSLAKMRENIATAKGTVLKIKDNAVTIAKNGVMIISKTATLLMAGAQWVLNSALLACPITWIVVGIGALIGVGVLLYKNWDTIKAKAFEVWEGVKTAFAPIVSFFGGLFESVTSGFKAFLNFFIKGINWVTDKINKISVDVPEWVPGLGGQKFGFDIPKIPEFALGTQYHKGGLARINERGGEIVNLPNGSKVIPHSLSKAGGGQTVVQNITIYADGKSIDEMVDEFVIRVKRGLANA